MMPHPKTGLYMLAVAGAFVIFMLGSRLSTLTFGRVFPEHNAEDQKKIQDLTTQVETLQADANKQADLKKQLDEAMAAESELQSQIEALKNAPPKIEYREVPVPSRATAERTPSAKPSKHAVSAVLHRGDSKEDARRIAGRPEQVEAWPGGGERWYYEDMSKYLQFGSDGHLEEWRGIDVEP